jgi:hypothetical protein
MVQIMRASGLKTNNMEKARKSGKMELTSWENMLQDKSKEMVLLIGQMAPLFRDNFKIIIFMVMGDMFGSMNEYSKENGNIIKCMDKVSLLGQMAGSTKDNTRMTKNAAMGSSHGLMDVDMKECGSTVSKMVKAYIYQAMDKRKGAFGKTESG